MAEGAQIDDAEEALAVWVRQQQREVGSEEILIQWKKECESHEIKDYYAARHPIGSDPLSAWLSEFLERHGLASVRPEVKFRSRRNGEELGANIIQGWRIYYELVERLENSVPGGEIDLTLWSFDETSMRRAAAQRVILPKEELQRRAAQGRGRPTVQQVELNACIGVLLCNNPAIPTADPLLALQSVPNLQIGVLLSLLF
jgi:hypothetical protein